MTSGQIVLIVYHVTKHRKIGEIDRVAARSIVDNSTERIVLANARDRRRLDETLHHPRPLFPTGVRVCAAVDHMVAFAFHGDVARYGRRADWGRMAHLPRYNGGEPSNRSRTTV